MALRAGGNRPLARWLDSEPVGKRNVLIGYWRNGAKPRVETVMDICDATGISFGWLWHGRGSDEEELAKVGQTTVREIRVARIEESAPQLKESVDYIMSRGEPSDVEILEKMLEAAASQIRTRRRASGQETPLPAQERKRASQKPSQTAQ